MRLIAAALLLIATLASPWASARAQDLPTADQDAIRGTIQAQLDAFRRDDAAAAYAAAAPGIRTLFPSPGVFMDMVRNGYAPVYRPRSADFTGLVLQDGHWVQQLEVIGPDGAPHLALYTMEREPDGSWRIAGCVLVASARVGV